MPSRWANTKLTGTSNADGYASQGLLLLDDLDALTEHVHVQSSHSWSNQRMSALKRYVSY
jgi:hypothetical protein